MLETPDPLSLDALRAADELEHELAKIPHVEAHSLLDLYRRGALGGGNQCRRGRAAAHVRHRNTAVPPRRTAGRPLFRHRTRAAREFARRARPRARGDRRARPAAREVGRTIHAGPARRIVLARRLARAANRRRDGAFHAAVRHFPDDAGADHLPLVAHAGGHHSHARRSGRDCDGPRSSVRLVAHGHLHPGAADRDGHDDRHARVSSFALYRTGRFADASRASRARARKQVPALHRLDVRNRGRLCRAGDLGHSPRARDGALDRVRTHRGVDRVLHAVSGAAVAVAHAAALGASFRSASGFRASSMRWCRRAAACAGRWSAALSR